MGSRLSPSPPAFDRPSTRGGVPGRSDGVLSEGAPGMERSGALGSALMRVTRTDS